jgi:hypothetical protein
VGLNLIETFLWSIFYVSLFFYSTTQFTNLFLSTASCSYDKFQKFQLLKVQEEHFNIEVSEANPNASTSPPLFMDHVVFCLLSLLASWRWFQEFDSLYHSIRFTYGMLSLLPIPFLNNYEISNFFSQSFNIFQI